MQPIIDAVVSVCAQILIVCAPIVAAFAARWLLAQARLMAARLSQEQLRDLETVAVMAVKGAEQLKLADRISDKKNYATQVVEAYLRERGVKLNVTAIEAAIESAVWDEFNRPEWGSKTPEPPAIAGTVMVPGVPPFIGSR